MKTKRPDWKPIDRHAAKVSHEEITPEARARRQAEREQRAAREAFRDAMIAENNDPSDITFAM